MEKELQQLKNMISADRYPKMDGSHRLDHSEAIRLIIQINDRINNLKIKIESEKKWFELFNDRHPDEVQDIIKNEVTNQFKP